MCAYLCNRTLERVMQTTLGNLITILSYCNAMKKILNFMKYAAIVAAFAAAMGYAGQSDYEDAIVAEMKNNGAYYRLSDEHPNMTDAQLIEVYKAEKDKER